MPAITADPARELTTYFRINRDGSLSFAYYDANGNPFSLTGYTFVLNFKVRKYDSINFLQLTSASGLSISGNTITASITATQSAKFREQIYYWELVRTYSGLTKNWLSGDAFFHYGKFDGVEKKNSTSSSSDDDVTIIINDLDQSVYVRIDEIPNLLQTLAVGNDGGGLQIKNIADPTDNQDALTLAYFNAHNTSGSSTFVSLTDGPGAFTGKTLNFVRVNAAETALEYRTPSQVLSDLGAQASLLSGSGTTYSANKINLGGALAANVDIDGAYNFYLGQSTPINALRSASTNGWIFTSNFAGGFASDFTSSTAVTSLTHALASNNSQGTVQLGYNSASLFAKNTSTGNFTSIDMTSAGVALFTNQNTTGGFKYAADYSSGYTSRSLIDKGYADAHLIGLTFTNSPSTNYIPQYNGANFTWVAGFTNPMTTLGDIIYEDATPTAARLAGNITSSMKILTQTGTGIISAAPVWTTTTGTAGSVVLSQSPIFSGTPTLGTLGYSDTGILWSWQSSTNSYNQVIIQNTNAGATASANYNVSNDQGSSTTNFAEFGINSSGFTGTGSFSQAGYAYVASASTDLVLGTYANKSIHFVVNSGATDALTISGAQLFTFTAAVPNNSFTSTWTATANNQYAFNFTGTITSRNTNSDSWNYLVINPTLTRNAGNPTVQTATALLINPTFSNSPTNQYLLRLQNAGTDRFIFNSGGGLIINNDNSNAGITIHSPNAVPYAMRIFNDTYSSSNAIFSFYPGNGGAFTMGTDVATNLSFYTNSQANPKFQIYSSGNIAISTTSISGGLSVERAKLYVAQDALTSSWLPVIQFEPGAHTSMTAGAEFSAGVFASSTQTWASGSSTLANQRYWYFKAPTVNAGIGNTITDTYNGYFEVPTNGSGTTPNLWALGTNGAVKFGGSLTMADATNFVFGTSTGTQLGTSTSQKLGHYGVTPIVQPANTVAIDTLLVNLGLRASGGVGLFDTDIKAGVVGKGFYVKEGSNATMGTATLSAGTATVNTTKVTANSRIFLTDQGGTVTNLGSLYISARTAGTSFTISSTNVLDTSDFAWIIIEPS